PGPAHHSQLTFRRRPLACIAAQVRASGQPASTQATTSARRQRTDRPSLMLGGNLPAARSRCQLARESPHKAAASGSHTSRGAMVLMPGLLAGTLVPLAFVGVGAGKGNTLVPRQLAA